MHRQIVALARNGLLRPGAADDYAADDYAWRSIDWPALRERLRPLLEAS